MVSTLGRLKIFIDSQSLTVSAFEKLAGFSNGSLASQIKNNKTIGVDKVENILKLFPDLNANWLLLGEGEMTKKTEQTQEKVNISTLSNSEEMDYKDFIEIQKQLISSQRQQIEMLKQENERLKTNYTLDPIPDEALKNR